jgi:hypothetical protein
LARLIKKEEKDTKRQDLMTQEEMTEINDIISNLMNNVGEMGEKYTEWSKIEVAYRGEQPTEKGRPNTRVNIMNANIEGQIAGIIDQNIAIVARGESPSDQHYSEFARVILEWTFRKNYIKKVLDQHERRRIKFGAGIFKVHFDPDAINGFGLTKITCVSLNRFLIDTKVKDSLRFQEAEYQGEPIRMSKSQIIEMYGEEKAAAVDYGNFTIENTTVFEETFTMDDIDGATIIQYWSKHKGILRLREFSACGVLLYDSHKTGDRKENQKNNKFDHKSYYKYVNNKYPYFFTGMYPIEGSLWGFGDGKLLEALNDLLNDFYDKIRIAARPNLILFDPMSEVDLSDFDDNSFEPRPADLRGGQTVDTVSWGVVNDSWWRMIAAIHQEAQRVTRFSDLMTGQNSSAANTATEATIQQQQGNSSTDQKKQILQITLQEVCEYILGISMESYTEAKAFRLTEDKEDYIWIDPREFTKVPAMKPATMDFITKYRAGQEANGVEKDVPKWELLTDEKTGEPMTKNVDLDIELNVGAGLPKNKAFLWQMIEKLSTMFSIDATGMKKTVVSYEELREFIKKFVGLPLEDPEELPQPPPMPPQNPMAPPQTGTPPMQGADSALSPNGSPMMSNLAPTPPQGGMLGG